MPSGVNFCLSTAVELGGAEACKKYYVVIYKDNGDKVFGQEKDTTIKNEEKVITTTLTVK